MLEENIGKLCKKNNHKYFQTLQGHTIDALKILKQYIEINRKEINEFCNRWHINTEQFYKNLFLMVYLHDIGKLTKGFQGNIRNGKHSNKYPHSFYAMGILDKLNIDDDSFDFVKLTILGHHSQLYGGLYNGYLNINDTEYLVNNINEFLSNAHTVYNNLNFSEYFKFDGFDAIEINKKPKPKKIWRILRDNLKYNYSGDYLLKNKKEEITKIKSIYCFMLSILKTADIFSSYNFEKYVLENDLNCKMFDNVLILENYISVLEKKYIPNFELYKYQKEIKNNAKKFQILFAPCGRGKTEASLLWAFEIMKKYNRNKIIFALPTQTTSNFMFDRLKREFGEENVGIYHGMSFIKLKNDENRKMHNNSNGNVDEYEDDYETETELLQKTSDENFKGEIFHKPITITTIDHLIYSFIHGYKKSDFALGNIQNAVIIFDEVHYYEKTTLSHLCQLFNILKEMNIPHLLMSGTIPNFLNEKIDYDTVVDNEGLNYKPFKMFFNEYNIFNENVFESIINNYIEGKTQFIILNTVLKSKKFYKMLIDKLKNNDIEQNVTLYHSQYTYKDRTKKEKEIKEKYNQKHKKPFILIATQVIEISLDISADIMYSEVAPIDAIGQRGGRLNRKGKNPDGVLYIYLPEKNIPYNNELMENTKDILKKYNFNAISYGDIKIMCDELYQNYNLEGSYLRRFFNENTLFGHSHKEIRYSDEEGKFFKVRENKALKIDVIPYNIYNNNKDNLKKENIVKYPYYKYKNEVEDGELRHFKIEYKDDKKKKPYIVCLHNYTYEYGFDDENDDEEFNEDEFLENLKNNNIIDDDII